MNGLDRLFQQTRRLQIEAGERRLRFSQSPSRAYVAENDRVAVEEREEELRASLAAVGLYGGFGALPDYFTDSLLQEPESSAAAREFLDLFNHRLLELFVQIWRDYRLMIEDPLSGRAEQGRRDARMLNRLLGQLAARDEPPHLRGQRWRRMGIYRRNTQTRLGMTRLLGDFFPELRIELETFQARWRPIPQEQRASLGKACARIGAAGDFLAGTAIKDVAGGFRLTFRGLDYASYMKLLPGGEWRANLRGLVVDYAKDRWECQVRLELAAEEIPRWQLGSRRLGLDMWLQSQPMNEAALVDAGAAS